MFAALKSLFRKMKCRYTLFISVVFVLCLSPKFSFRWMLRFSERSLFFSFFCCEDSAHVSFVVTNLLVVGARSFVLLLLSGVWFGSYFKRFGSAKLPFQGQSFLSLNFLFCHIFVFLHKSTKSGPTAFANVMAHSHRRRIHGGIYGTNCIVP